MRVHVATIQNGGAPLLAAGTDPDWMRMYSWQGDLLMPSPLFFPGILHMMPYAEVTSKDVVEVGSLREALEQYGRVERLEV